MLVVPNGNPSGRQQNNVAALLWRLPKAHKAPRNKLLLDFTFRDFGIVAVVHVLLVLFLRGLLLGLLGLLGLLLLLLRVCL